MLWQICTVMYKKKNILNEKNKTFNGNWLQIDRETLDSNDTPYSYRVIC